LPKSPFSFDEKVKMMTLTGVPVNKILNVKNNYNLQSVSSQIPINVKRDSIIFAVSEKDMAEGHIWLENAAEQNHTKSQIVLGKVYGNLATFNAGNFFNSRLLPRCYGQLPEVVLPSMDEW